MDEGISIRAITIGVSVFIAIITMSVVLMYYSTAKNTVSEIGTGLDISVTYNRNIEKILVKDTITGEELKNLINYYYQNLDVDINIKKIKVVGSNGIVSYETITGSNANLYLNVNNNKKNYNNVMKKIISNTKFKLEKISSGMKLTLNIEGE